MLCICVLVIVEFENVLNIFYLCKVINYGIIGYDFFIDRCSDFIKLSIY